MNISCVGLNWKTPIGVRERVAFDADALKVGLALLHAQYASDEFAIISTCNRTEIYSASTGQGSNLGAHQLINFLSDARDVSIDELYPHLYRYEGIPAVQHLFHVAGGLDSLILGEVQILGQVKSAYQSAIEGSCAGPVLHALFQKALNVAKRIQTETSLSKGRLSIASAAVDYIRGVFETFRDKSVLIIGAGKMAELTVKHLRELEPARLIVTNRNPERAKELADRFGGEAWPFEQLSGALTEADIVLSSTAAEEPIIRAREFAAIMKARKQRLIALIDIALPRDFDDAIAELPNVLLWNIDDLEKVRHQTIHARRSELHAAEAIVEEELKRFAEAIASIKTGPLISRLEQVYQQIIDDELAWLLPQLNGLSDAHRDKIQHFAHRLKNKLLHPPKRALKEHAQEGRHHLLDALQRLFGLHRDES